MYAGIDIGTDYTQAVAVRDGELLGTGETKTGFDLDDATEAALGDALADAGADRDAVETTVATGTGSANVEADRRVDTFDALWHGLSAVRPDARSVLLMGAKNVAALRFDADGTVEKSVENGKCAAGVGRFLSDLTRYLDMDLEEMIEAVLSVDEGVEDLNARCSVFAESEVISLIHEGVPRARIARGVYESVAGRNGSLLRRVGFDDEVVVVGGVGRNEAFLDALADAIETTVSAPDDPAHVPAFGAALSAATVVPEGRP
ncbi:acyl-CoA dehydratase activase [Halobacteriaceae archaeon GCM10025711]